MKLEQLTQKVLNDIFKIYKETTGCSIQENRCPRVEDAIECFQRGSLTEWRLGSKFSGHSKLYITLYGGDLEFVFYPNCDPRNKTEERGIEKTVETFNKRTKDYLA